MGDFAHSQPANSSHGQAHAALRGLPDERTAQRLLDVLMQLEHNLANVRPVNVTPPVSEPTQTSSRQQQALVRLDGLIAQLEMSLAANGADSKGESPAV
jgi:hypothetical protein